MIIQVNNLRIGNEHGGHLSDITFTVGEGDWLYIRCPVLILGTALLKALIGMPDNAQGEVWLGDDNLLDNLDSNHLLQLRQQLALVYRERGLISLLNVQENIALPLGYHHRISKEQLAARVIEVAETLRIRDLLQRGPEELNEMQTRLVNLGRALICKPRLLLIDGILEGMPAIQERVTGAIRSYQEREGFGVVMTGRTAHIDFTSQAYNLTQRGLVPLGG